MCKANETVIKYCGKLKQTGKIHDYYLCNGFIKIIGVEGEKPKKVCHPDNLFQQFDDLT